MPKLNDEISEMVINTVNTLGLDYAAVDIISDEDRDYVLEVNDSPGLEGIEKATGIDLATQVLQRLIDLS